MATSANLEGEIWLIRNIWTSSLRDSHLAGAILRGANLEQVYISGADLRGADLRDVPWLWIMSLTLEPGVQLAGLRWDHISEERT